MPQQEHQALAIVGRDEAPDLEARERKQARQRRDRDPWVDPVRAQVSQRAAGAGLQAVGDERRNQKHPEEEEAASPIPPRWRRIDRQSGRHPENHASATYGSSNGHDMWICRTQVMAAPIRKNATGSGIFPSRKVGTASKKPMKKTSAGASR